MRKRALCMAAGFAVAASACGSPVLGESAVSSVFPPAVPHVIWYADDARDIAMPDERAPNMAWDEISETFVRPIGRHTNPVRVLRGVGGLFGADPARPASDINALDEAVNSSWFTNRIGLFPMDPDEVARGPRDGAGPDRGGPWVIVRAKSEGVTPGFNIRDPKGQVFVIKFDPPGYPNASTAAGVISGRLLHAAGYNVPDDSIVRFSREDLVVGEGVRLTLPDGSKRAMTRTDVDALLSAVHRGADGKWRAVASRFLEGKPLGPFDYNGVREDDPNDRIPHEHRRELRGLRMFAAWLNHFDTKQHNTLDMYVEEDGRRFVRHYLIDFASTLGMGALGPMPMYGHEYAVDVEAIAIRALTLGLREDRWRGLRHPEGLEEVGFFESERFEPMGFEPILPNTAFAHMTDRDGYWAAKIISAFRDAHIEAAVAAGRYDEPEAAAYVARTLAQRRDKITRHFFDRVPPLDFFAWSVGGSGSDSDGGLEPGARNRIVWRDLGEERGIYPGTVPHYRYRTAAVAADGDRRARTDWVETPVPVASLDGSVDGPLDASSDVPSDGSLDRPVGGPAATPILEVEVQVNRGFGWSGSVRARFAVRDRRILSVER